MLVKHIKFEWLLMGGFSLETTKQLHLINLIYISCCICLASQPQLWIVLGITVCNVKHYVSPGFRVWQRVVTHSKFLFMPSLLVVSIKVIFLHGYTSLKLTEKYCLSCCLEFNNYQLYFLMLQAINLSQLILHIILWFQFLFLRHLWKC